MSKDKSEYLIDRKDNQYEVVIGLEVHAQVTSESKLFSSSSTKFGAEPNTQVSLVDAAFPGMLPVINEFCVKQAIKTGIGLKAQINKRSVFDRKFVKFQLVKESLPKFARLFRGPEHGSINVAAQIDYVKLTFA